MPSQSSSAAIEPSITPSTPASQASGRPMRFLTTKYNDYCQYIYSAAGSYIPLSPGDLIREARISFGNDRKSKKAEVDSASTSGNVRDPSEIAYQAMYKRQEVDEFPGRRAVSIDTLLCSPHGFALTDKVDDSQTSALQLMKEWTGVTGKTRPPCFRLVAEASFAHSMADEQSNNQYSEGDLLIEKERTPSDGDDPTIIKITQVPESVRSAMMDPLRTDDPTDWKRCKSLKSLFVPLDKVFDATMRRPASSMQPSASSHAEAQ